ncbi:MAG TPA: histidine phosphatase family protein, partial [Casimicrobiaceae bacterium]
MHLILWRHAEAEAGEPDLARRLTAKGVKQAARTGKWLDEHLPANCRILVSPAKRAQQTAEALKRKFRTRDELAPNVDA